MENTDKLFYGDQSQMQSEWFVAQGQDWTGPFTAKEVVQRIAAGELSWTHLAWKAGMEGWKKIAEISDFRALLPQPAPAVSAPVQSVPPVPVQSESPPKVQVAADVREWFLYFNDSQYGPFSMGEVLRLHSAGKITSRVHAWKKGMDKWERIERLSVFGLPASVAKTSDAEKKSEKRKYSRKPMEARVLLAQGSEVLEGICRDVSVGGMQVLTKRTPGPVGTRLQLNIDTRKQSGQAPSPFVAEGVVVRNLEDGRGFCFRFSKLSDEAQKAIEQWIHEEDSD